jgi:hypothetical protein
VYVSIKNNENHTRSKLQVQAGKNFIICKYLYIDENHIEYYMLYKNRNNLSLILF